MFEELETELKIRGFSKRTVESYLYHNKKFHEFTKKDPANIDERDAKKYIAYLMSERKYKPRSLNLALSAVKFFFNEIIKNSAFNAVKSPKTGRNIPTVLTKNEIKQILAATQNPKHRLLIEFMYSAGLRVSECVSMKLDDLDFNEKVGKVKHGKGNKERYIILSDILIHHLKEYIKGKKDESPYIFSVSGRPITTRQAQKVYPGTSRPFGPFNNSDLHKSFNAANKKSQEPI